MNLADIGKYNTESINRFAPSTSTTPPTGAAKLPQERTPGGTGALEALS
jgi:hypothetical protein